MDKNIVDLEKDLEDARDHYEKTVTLIAKMQYLIHVLPYLEKNGYGFSKGHIYNPKVIAKKYWDETVYQSVKDVPEFIRDIVYYHIDDERELGDLMPEYDGGAK